MNDFEYTVCARCMTYNQTSCIMQALRGFCIQETNFPVVYTIVDDASSDGEQKLLLKWCKDNLFVNEHGVSYEEELDYGKAIFARHKIHSNLYFYVLLLKQNHYKRGLTRLKQQYLEPFYKKSKYLATCEGDDYWTSAHKLQKQVDFMDSHTDFSMCFHKADVVVESGDYTAQDNSMYDDLEEREYSGLEIAQRWCIPTASILYRSHIRRPACDKFLEGDVPLELQCALEGRIFCMNETMSVYRRTSSGVTLDKRTPLQKVDRLLAYIHYYPPYKGPFEDGLIKLLGFTFFSRDMKAILNIVLRRRATWGYFIKGVLHEFKPALKRKMNSSKKISVKW